MKKRAWHVLAAGIGLAATGTAALADDRADFLQEYRCAIVERLSSIHEHGDPKGRDRFIALDPVRKPGGYVQCLFIEEDRRMLCEAASGFYDQPKGRPRHYLKPEAVAALAQLGFLTDDSKGNFQQMMDTHDGTSLPAVADLLLGALYDAYGVRAAVKIEVVAPLAPGFSSVLRPSDCDMSDAGDRMTLAVLSRITLHM